MGMFRLRILRGEVFQHPTVIGRRRCVRRLSVRRRAGRFDLGSYRLPEKQHSVGNFQSLPPSWPSQTTKLQTRSLTAPMGPQYEFAFKAVDRGAPRNAGLQEGLPRFYSEPGSVHRNTSRPSLPLKDPTIIRIRSISAQIPKPPNVTSIRMPVP